MWKILDMSIMQELASDIFPCELELRVRTGIELKEKFVANDPSFIFDVYYSSSESMVHIKNYVDDFIYFGKKDHRFKVILLKETREMIEPEADKVKMIKMLDSTIKLFEPTEIKKMNPEFYDYGDRVKAYTEGLEYLVKKTEVVNTIVFIFRRMDRGQNGFVPYTSLLSEMF
eukprot:UN34701